MKDDLIRILNLKLKQIKENILELNRLNNEIKEETDNLEYIQQAISNFKSEDHGFDIYKFSNIDHVTFNDLLMNLSDEVLTKFGTNSCNYEGLIYLINGINNGISLTLTQEQVDAINLFIDKLLEKEQDYQNVINDLNNCKQKLEFKDLDELMNLDNKYSLIIENIEDKKYVNEIDEVIEAINYSELSLDQTFDILCYLLKYNSEIYNQMKEERFNKEETNVEEEKIDLTKPFEETEEKEQEVVKNIDLTDSEETKEIEDKVENEAQEESEFGLSFVKTEEESNFNNLNEEPIESDSVNEIIPNEESEIEYNPVLPNIPEEPISDDISVENESSLNENAQSELNNDIILDSNLSVATDNEIEFEMPEAAGNDEPENSDNETEKVANQDISIILPSNDAMVENESVELEVTDGVVVDNNLSVNTEVKEEAEMSEEGENALTETEDTIPDNEYEMPINFDLSLPTIEEKEMVTTFENVVPTVNLVGDIATDNNF